MTAAEIIGKVAAKHPALIWHLRYLKRFHRIFSPDAPRDLYELMAGLAIRHADDPLWARVADKAAVREFVADRIGEQYLTHMIAVWDSPDKIDFDALPSEYALKTTNGCGTNIIVRKGDTIDPDKTRQALASWLSNPYGQLTGQLHYTHIPPRILAEEILSDGNPGGLADYKFYCFDGKPVYMLLCTNRVPNSHKYDRMVYDMGWNECRDMVEMASENYPPNPKPKCWDELKELAAKLSKGFEFVRVDFYVIDSRPVFGEITLTPGLDYHTAKFLDINQYRHLLNQ